MKLNPKLTEQVRTLIQQNKPVEALGLVNKIMQCGLRKAKDLVDEIRKEQGKI